jgi:hypothetical protein
VGSSTPTSVTPSTGSRRLPVHRAFRQFTWKVEVSLFLVALMVYQLSRALVIGDPALAFRNATSLIDWEKAKGLFVEGDVQGFFFNYPGLIRGLNYFYLYAHWVVTIAFFVWLYRKRPVWYPYVRNAFFAANALALTVFMVFPVAPPRLMGGTFIDTLQTISGVDLHGGKLARFFNPYAAVPSMHFGYALMIGIVVASLLKSWPLRAIALAYPAVVFLTIVGTANHYVVDSFGGAAAVLLGFGIAATWLRASKAPTLVPDRPDWPAPRT